MNSSSLERMIFQSFNLTNTVINKTLPIIRDTVNLVHPLEKDVAVFSGVFTPSEQNLMEEVRQYGIKNRVETPRLIDRHKRNITSNYNLIELPDRYAIYPKNNINDILKNHFGEKNQKIIAKVTSKMPPALHSLFNSIVMMMASDKELKSATLLHDHTVKLPLSTLDLKQAADKSFEKTIAITLDGSISCMTMPPLIRSILDYQNIGKAFQKLEDSNIAKSKELNLPFDKNILDADPEKIKLLSEHLEKELKEFAKNTGAHYYSEGF